MGQDFPRGVLVKRLRAETALLEGTPMPKHMFIIPLMALSIAGVADTVRAMNARTAAASEESQSGLPNLNIESGCQDVAKNELNRTTDYPGCISKERATREQLRKEWSSYPADTHEHCVNLVTPPALPSYVTLQECLKIARDAQKMTKNEGATEIGKTMQAPSRK